MTAYPIFVWDPVTEQWLPVCGPRGPAGPVGAMGATGATGATGAAGGDGVGLPTGTLGDLVWFDGTAWVPLPADGSPGDELTLVDVGGTPEPQWAPEAAATDDEVICGMTRFLVRQLLADANFIIHETLLVITMYLRDSSIGETTLLGFFTLLDPFFSILSGPISAIIGGISGTSVDDLGKALPPIQAAQQEDLAHYVFCAIQSSTGIGAVTSSTITALHDYLDAYPNFYQAADGHYYQRDVLHAVLDAHDPTLWNTWAQRGAADPSHSCSDFSCAGLLG